MPTSEKRKKYKNDWDKQNRKIVGISLNKQQHEKLSQYIKSHNTNASDLIKERIKDIID